MGTCCSLDVFLGHVRPVTSTVTSTTMLGQQKAQAADKVSRRGGFGWGHKQSPAQSVRAPQKHAENHREGAFCAHRFSPVIGSYQHHQQRDDFCFFGNCMCGWTNGRHFLNVSQMKRGNSITCMTLVHAKMFTDGLTTTHFLSSFFLFPPFVSSQCWGPNQVSYRAWASTLPLSHLQPLRQVFWSNKRASWTLWQGESAQWHWQVHLWRRRPDVSNDLSECPHFKFAMMTSALRVREHGKKQKKGAWKGLDGGNRKVEVT